MTINEKTTNPSYQVTKHDIPYPLSERAALNRKLNENDNSTFKWTDLLKARPSGNSSNEKKCIDIETDRVKRSLGNIDNKQNESLKRKFKTKVQIKSKDIKTLNYKNTKRLITADAKLDNELAERKKSKLKVSAKTNVDENLDAELEKIKVIKWKDRSQAQQKELRRLTMAKKRINEKDDSTFK